GNGLGSFSPATNLSTGSAPLSVAVGDFDGDGKQDLAVANYNSANVAIFLGNGAGSFVGPISFVTGINPLSLAVGDFDTDGKQDLAVARWNSTTVSILLRDCAYPTTTKLTSSTNPSSYGMSVTFTANVQSATGAPSGSVRFLDGTTLLGSVAVDSNGKARFTTYALNAGSHSITAEYGGNNDYL